MLDCKQLLRVRVPACVLARTNVISTDSRPSCEETAFFPRLESEVISTIMQERSVLPALLANSFEARNTNKMASQRSSRRCGCSSCLEPSDNHRGYRYPSPARWTHGSIFRLENSIDYIHHALNFYFSAVKVCYGTRETVHLRERANDLMHFGMSKTFLGIYHRSNVDLP